MPLPFGLGAPMVMRRMASRLCRYSGASRTIIGKLPVAAILVEVARRLAADRRLARSH